MTQPLPDSDAPHSARHRARIVLLAFVLTFITSRVVTFLIMARRMPDLYLHLGGTHVHHLNYGIFLLAGVGAFLLFAPGSPRRQTTAGLVYGIGLALTFDEFGMWLHLGGGYWQRASFDAIIVLASLLALFGFAPPLRRWRPRHVATALLTLAAVAIFGLLLAESFRFASREQPKFERLEQGGPG
jgi:glucose dehydrogenase